MVATGKDQAEAVDRLVPSPVFILAPLRSGSTLLRVLLNSHSLICAPHEIHLRTLRVTYEEPYTSLAIERLGLDQAELEHLLWDRLLHWELDRSGKKIIVDKTPGNALVWPRIHKCWPQAKYIFLIRHPGSIFSSMSEVSPNASPEATARLVLQYINGVEWARNELPGCTVRYEELTADPAGTTQRLCSFLGVHWEPQMLQYGEFPHGLFEKFLGDFTEKIKSGTIRPPRELPDSASIIPSLRNACQRWDYLPGPMTSSGTNR
jgi:hypothetical protein